MYTVKRMNNGVTEYFKKIIPATRLSSAVIVYDRDRSKATTYQTKAEVELAIRSINGTLFRYQPECFQVENIYSLAA